MDITGRIKAIHPTESFGANGFRKRELVVTTEEQYPQHILIEFTQDKCDILNTYSVGEPVKVNINLRGREWVNPQGETKYFNSIQGWQIQREGYREQPAQQGYHGQGSAVNEYQSRQQSTYQNPPSSAAENDDLPF